MLLNKEADKTLCFHSSIFSIFTLIENDVVQQKQKICETHDG